MKPFATTLFAILASLPLSSTVCADVEIYAVAESDVEEFHVAVSSHFQVEKRVVLSVVSEKISDHDTPVVFFIAREAKVPHHKVVSLRLIGKSWFEIATHFGLTSHIFHVEVKANHLPYGRAVGHYKYRARTAWHEIILSDSDVTALVHLKFLSAHHGWEVQHIVDLHRKHKLYKFHKNPMSFVKFHAAYKKHGLTGDRNVKAKPDRGAHQPAAKKSTPFRHEKSAGKAKRHKRGGGKTKK
jgi:uncharacterized protein (UPF0248 family)